MKKNILFLLVFLSYSVNAQMVPSFLGVYDKKSSVSDSWDTSNKGSYISISNNTVTSTNSTPNHSWNSVYGTEAVSSGTKTWELTVDTYYNSSGNFWELIIGVADDRSNGSTYFPANCKGWCYISEIGKKNNNTGVCGSQTDYGATYGQGDVIKVSLNMSNGELRFYKNGTDQGVAYTVDTSKTWYLACSIGNNGTSVSITG